MAATQSQTETEDVLTVADLLARDPYENHSSLAPKTEKADHIIQWAWDELETPVTEFEDMCWEAGHSPSYVREVLERVSDEAYYSHAEAGTQPAWTR